MIQQHVETPRQKKGAEAGRMLACPEPPSAPYIASTTNLGRKAVDVRDIIAIFGWDLQVVEKARYPYDESPFQVQQTNDQGL